MNKRDRFDIHWVGQCKYDQHDKVWGWFFYNPERKVNAMPSTFHVFWARTGKSLSFTTHSYDKWQIKRLVADKQTKKYQGISLDKLEEIWPSFYDDLESRFLLHALRQG
jgi:hypothetical protein